MSKTERSHSVERVDRQEKRDDARAEKKQKREDTQVQADAQATVPSHDGRGARLHVKA